MIVPSGYRSLADTVDTVLADGRPDQIEHALLMLRRMVFVDEESAALIEHFEQRLADALTPPIERLLHLQQADAWMQGLVS